MGSAALLGAVVLSAFLLAGPVGGAGGGSPLAEAGLDQQVRLGETVRLDATGSDDPDGSLVGYRWRIRTPSGRTVSPLSPHAARTTFPATATGRYEVRLTVTDDDGNTGTDTMYVLVEAAASGSPLPGPADGNGSAARRGSRAGAGSATGASAVRPTSADSASPDSTAHPRVNVEGPVVVVAEHSYTYDAVTSGLADARTYDWDGGDTGRSHTLLFRTRGEFTTRVVVEDERGRVASDGLEVFVSPAGNEPPEVEIVDPGSVSPGQRLTLSVDASDPDGRILSTEWSPGRGVRVPDDGSSRTVRVTVTDDDGASVTDSITVSGRAWNETLVDTDTTDVTCYFTNERQRDGRHPMSDRCITENGNTVSLTNGPSRIESWRRNEKIDLHWRRTDPERLQDLRANDTSTDYGVAAKSPHDEADVYGLSDDPVQAWITGRWADVDNVEAFTLKGKTVEDDLDGDGEVNAADWDQRYRTSSDTTNVDRHADAVTGFKRSIRGEGGGAEDDGGVFESSRRASASTIRGTYAGTTIDADTRRDRIATLSHRTTGGSDRDGVSRSADDSGSADGGTGVDRTDDRDDTSDSGGSDRSDDTDDTDDSDHSDDTSDSGDTNRTADAEPSDTDSGSDGPSRHSPHGGRIVTHP